MIDVGWAMITQVTEWGQAAFAAARKKSEERYARVVEHAAILVSGVSTLNRRLHSLLQPLAHFDPSEWDQTRRNEHVAALIAFSSEDTILPRMRTSRSALRGLLVGSDDVDVQRVAGRILARADNLFGDPYLPARRAFEAERGYELYPGRDPPASPTGFAPGDPDDVAHALNDIVFAAFTQRDNVSDPEGTWHSGLPALLGTFRRVDLNPTVPADLDPQGQTEWHRKRRSDIDRVRTLALELLAVKPGGGHGANLPEAELQGALFPAATDMQNDLGELLAISQRVFPAMPTPPFAV